MFYIVPDFQVPDVVVNEDDGIAQVCVELGNEIENVLIVDFTTGIITDSANGIPIQLLKHCVFNSYFNPHRR